jgi:hypothetical protein
MASKVDKALYGPSMLEVAFGAILGLIAGVLACCVYLVFKPVQTVRELPKEPVKGVVYFLPGNESSGKARDWQNKQKRFLAGGSIKVNEEELNAWGASLAAPAAPAKDAKAGEPAPAAPGGAFFSAGAPNFKIMGEKLQVGFKCKVDYFGLGTEVQVVALGQFEKSGDHVEFDAESVTFGSCPLDRVPLVGHILIAKLGGLHKVSDEWKAAWTKVSEAAIAANAVNVTIQ